MSGQVASQPFDRSAPTVHSRANSQYAAEEWPSHHHPLGFVLQQDQEQWEHRHGEGASCNAVDRDQIAEKQDTGAWIGAEEHSDRLHQCHSDSVDPWLLSQQNAKCQNGDVESVW